MSPCAGPIMCTGSLTSGANLRVLAFAFKTLWGLELFRTPVVGYTMNLLPSHIRSRTHFTHIMKRSIWCP